jgi:hypothetical protein
MSTINLNHSITLPLTYSIRDMIEFAELLEDEFENVILFPEEGLEILNSIQKQHNQACPMDHQNLLDEIRYFLKERNN